MYLRDRTSQEWRQASYTLKEAQRVTNFIHYRHTHTEASILDNLSGKQKLPKQVQCYLPTSERQVSGTKRRNMPVVELTGVVKRVSPASGCTFPLS